MAGSTRWIAITVISLYVAMATLEAIAMTGIRLSDTVPADMPTEQAAYYLAMPWVVIIAGWIANFIYVASLGLLVFGQRWTTRLLSIAVAIDVLSWIWARATTNYALVHSPAEQTLDALLFAGLLVIVVLMMMSRRTGTLT